MGHTTYHVYMLGHMHFSGALPAQLVEEVEGSQQLSQYQELPLTRGRQRHKRAQII